MFIKHLQLFSKATDSGAGGGPAGDTKILPAGDSKEDFIEFLADDDEPETIPLGDSKEIGKDKTLPKEGKDDDKIIAKGDESEEEEPDELELLEEELEEPSDDQLELVTPVRRREILAKYPQLFKDFPYLEKAYYREQQYTELLPTIEDAKTAVEKSNILDGFERDVMNGNIGTILKSIKDTNENAFYRIVDGYLSTLNAVDEKAYLHILGNVAKHTIMTMIQESRRLGVGTEKEPGQGMALQQGAHILNQFVFGSSEWKPPTNLSRDEKPEDNTREKQLSEREQGFIRQQFETARGELNSRVNNTLRNTIEANIDPKQSMTEYIRKTASREALDTLERLINQDTRFKSLIDKLWESVFKSNFSREATERIKSAYVSKAKTLLPSVIKKARNEALRGMGKRVKDGDEQEETTLKQGPIAPGRPRSQTNTGKITSAKEIPKGMTTLEFLNSD
jgi:hypothetical protein